MKYNKREKKMVLLGKEKKRKSKWEEILNGGTKERNKVWWKGKACAKWDEDLKFHSHS